MTVFLFITTEIVCKTSVTGGLLLSPLDLSFTPDSIGGR